MKVSETLSSLAPNITTNLQHTYYKGVFVSSVLLYIRVLWTRCVFRLVRQLHIKPVPLCTYYCCIVGDFTATSTHYANPHAGILLRYK
jgi:hypothetical protein